MTVRVGVNGFGRIGRNVWRALEAQKRQSVQLSQAAVRLRELEREAVAD